jgi:hypothetical protein
MGVNIEHKDISVSHRIPVSKLYQGREIEPTIIVKFVSRDTKELFYRARKHLKDKTTRNLEYDKANKIYINKSLTEADRKLFKVCMKVKREHNFVFLRTSNEKFMFVRENIVQLFISSQRMTLLRRWFKDKWKNVKKH